MVARKKYLFTDALGKHRVRIKGKTYPLRDERDAGTKLTRPKATAFIGKFCAASGPMQNGLGLH